MIGRAASNDSSRRFSAWMAGSLLLHALLAVALGWARPLEGLRAAPDGQVALELRLGRPAPRGAPDAGATAAAAAPARPAEPAEAASGDRPVSQPRPRNESKGPRRSERPATVAARGRPEAGRHAGEGVAASSAAAAGSDSGLSDRAAGSAQAGGAATSPGDDLSPLLALLHREIERHKRYPAAARRMQQEGVARVGFRLGPGGRIEQIALANSSGHAGLDDAALSAVTEAAPFAEASPLVQRSIALQVDVAFRLE